MIIQSKRGSFIEACINTFIGFIVSLAANPIVCWVLDVKMRYTQMGYYVLIFTVLSVIRGYVIRRWFNKSIERTVQKILNQSIKFDDTAELLKKVEEVIKD